jgi:hypothetical protein
MINVIHILYTDELFISNKKALRFAEGFLLFMVVFLIFPYNNLRAAELIIVQGIIIEIIIKPAIWHVL